jgi:hypothetical protein
MSDISDASGGDTAEGEVTAEELQQVQSPEQITERTSGHFQPNYDAVADDDSYAEAGDGGY